MAGFGNNPFPRRFGGGPSIVEQEHQALLDALAPGWDTDPDVSPENWAELYAYALALTIIWASNARLRNQMIPSEMLENLPVWEETLKIKPTKEQTVQARRRMVAARMIVLTSNAIADLQAAVVAIAGAHFVEIRIPDNAQTWTFWPGVNPGPPGFEWTSNRALLTIVMDQGSLSNSEFFGMMGQINDILNLQAPAWLSWAIGVDSGGGFVAGVGITGLTLL